MSPNTFHCGIAAAGRRWRSIQVWARCDCEWRTATTALFDDDGGVEDYELILAALSAQLDDHSAATAHILAGDLPPGTVPGFHSRCGTFHDLEDACPTPPSSGSALVDRAEDPALDTVARALDQLTALSVLERFAGEMSETAVVRARYLGAPWEAIARQLGVTRQAAFRRYRDADARAAAAGYPFPRSPAGVRRTTLGHVAYVLYDEAEPETRAALFSRAERELGLTLPTKPPAGSALLLICTQCNFPSTIHEIGIAYGDVEAAGAPVCPTRGCSGIGWAAFALRTVPLRDVRKLD
jgi:hypothetical protein